MKQAAYRTDSALSLPGPKLPSLTFADFPPSKASRFFTLQTMFVDGGLTVKDTRALPAKK